MANLRHRILVKEPDVRSMAAMVLLNRQYTKAELEKWFSFREKFLHKHEPLKCVYCGKGNLIIDGEECADGHGLGHLATIDHVVPVSKGGSRYDESNCVVACFKCNQKKKDTLISECSAVG